MPETAASVPSQAVPATLVKSAKVREFPADCIVRPSSPVNKHITGLWIPKEMLIDVVYDPKDGIKLIALGCNADNFKVLDWFDEFAARRDSPINLPSACEPCLSLDDLAADMRLFIHDYFECEPDFESVATLYALHTWIYERFNAVPYLRFLGISGSGKSRAAETIGALCYRTYGVSGSATPAAIFRLIETIGGTLRLDEADWDKSGIGNEIVKVLNCGYSVGTPVLRTEEDEKQGRSVRSFDVFGPKIISGRKPFHDDAIENRCITHRPGPLTRDDIPRQLPEDFKQRARTITNKALGWRFAALDHFHVHEVRLPNVRPRTQQIAMPLLLIAEILKDPTFNQHLVQYINAGEKAVLVSRSEMDEAVVIRSYIQLRTKQAGYITCGDLAKEIIKVEQENRPDANRQFSPQRVGSICDELGFEKDRQGRGMALEIKPTLLKSLCEKFGV